MLVFPPGFSVTQRPFWSQPISPTTLWIRIATRFFVEKQLWMVDVPPLLPEFVNLTACAELHGPSAARPSSTAARA